MAILNFLVTSADQGQGQNGKMHMLFTAHAWMASGSKQQSLTWLAKRPTWVATRANRAGSLTLHCAMDTVVLMRFSCGRSHHQCTLPHTSCANHRFTSLINHKARSRCAFGSVTAISRSADKSGRCLSFSHSPTNAAPEIAA